jgi:phage-related protein
MHRTVIFYRTSSGRCPVEEFLDSLPSKVAQKVLWVVQLVRELDVVPGQYLRKLVDTDGLWECRIAQGGNIYRLFAFFESGDLVILTHGIMKKTQKTPPAEIRKADECRADWMRRRQ